MDNSRLEVVVTARPSWARVKSLIEELHSVSKNVSVSLLGPSLSEKFGDIRSQIPSTIPISTFNTLQNGSELDAVALTAFHGGHSLIRHWKLQPPNSVLVVADRTETLGVSAAAAIMQIPIIHLQGGEVTGTIDDKIRDTNSKLADLHLTTNESSRQRLLKLGESDHLIHIIGCPSIDIVKKVMVTRVVLDFDHIEGVGCQIEDRDEFGLIMFHPDTLNLMQSLEWVANLIELVEQSAIKWIWFWPNPDFGSDVISKIIRRSREVGKMKNVRFIINLPPEEFIELALRSSIIIGNSSFGIREASFIGLPAINLGERQRGRDYSFNVTNIETPNLEVLVTNFDRLAGQRFASSHLYGDGTAGKRGAQIIQKWKPSLKRREE